MGNKHIHFVAESYMRRLVSLGTSAVVEYEAGVWSWLTTPGVNSENSLSAFV